MALTPGDAEKVATDLLADLSNDLNPRSGSKGVVKRYLSGDHDLPYMPRGAKAEYRHLAERSRTPWLPLISDTFSKALFVDGYRPAKSAENAAPWDYWQANGLDARQTIAHRGALEYGTAYVLVLPGDDGPVIRPLPPTRTHAVYADPDDEFPVFGLVTDGRAESGDRMVRLFDSESVWTFTVKAGDSARVASVEEHGLGVTPLVRFRDRLDGEAAGIIAPLIGIQDRINETVFSLQIALQYASFRQRWATGLAIPMDEDTTLADGVTPNPNFGLPVEPFEAAVDRLWVTDSPDAKFGDFAQTEVSGHLLAYTNAVKTLAAVAQTSPLLLLGDLSNVSGEALAGLEATTQRKIAEYETIFGEAWEQTLRLASVAAGDDASAADTSAQVRWRDTEARSLAQTVDALGKMAQMLGIPAEGLWERVPGVTDQDVDRWRSLRQEGDVFGALVTDLTRQAAPADTAQAPATPEA